MGHATRIHRNQMAKRVLANEIHPTTNSMAQAALPIGKCMSAALSIE